MKNKEVSTPKRRRMVSNQLARFTTPGTSYTGTLITKETQTFGSNVVGRYVLENDAATYVVNGGVQLDEAMGRVEVGQEVEILYTGDAQTQLGYTVKNYEVYVMEDADSDA